MNSSRGKEKDNSTETETALGETGEDTRETSEGPAAVEESLTISRDEYEKLVQEAARSREQYLLAVADFENFRKRVEKEKEDIVCFANEKLISQLLPILDNLQRALSMKLDQAGVHSVLEGVRMVNDQLQSVLGTCGLEPVEAVGSPFDPQHHEAIGVLPSEEHDEGTVISELQKGYRLKGRVLRPSMVHVAGQPGGDRENQGDK